MHKTRFAIVGCGRIAQRHAEHMNNKGELVAVCDSVTAKAATLAATYQVRGYGSIDELLHAEAAIDVIAVCTPNGLHADHSIKALEAGCHVVCEKPMALHIHDCERMIRAAEKANRQLFVVKQNRFNPPVAALKKALVENRLGKIYSVQLNCFWNRDAAYYRNSWKGTLDLDGGTLYTQFSHFIDILYWMFGDVVHIQAMRANYGHKGVIEFEDTGVAILQFKGGMVGTLHYTVNSFGKNMEGSITVVGEKGTVKVGGQYLNELEYQAIDGYAIKDLPPGNPANAYGAYEGSMSNHGKVYDNVLQVLQGKASMSASAIDGLNTVSIIEKIYSQAAWI